MPDIRMPDGQVVRFPDDMPEQQIRGLIASKYPREVGEATRSRGPSERDTSGHFGFDGSNVPGYNPETGMVERDPSRTMAALTGALEGIPIAGPILQNTAENIASGIVSSLENIPQADIRRDMHAGVEQSQAAYPGTTGVANVGGAALGTIPMVLAAPAAFGAGAGSLLARSGASALTGSVIGGADSAVRSGGDPRAAAEGAGWGFGLGAVAPGIGQVAGAGVRRLVEAGRRLFPGGPSAAIQNFGRAASADAVDDVAGRLSGMGDDAMPMDLGPNLRQQAGSLASTPGRGQEIVRSAVRSRDAGANQRITSAIDENLGRAVPPAQIERGLTRTQRSLGPEYERVLENARAVNTEAIANDIQSMIANERGEARGALQRVLDMLRIDGTDILDPHPRAALATRQAIDGMIENTQDTNVQRVLRLFRQRLDGELAQSAPNIKAVDQKYARLARQKEAVERGQTVLDSGRNTPWPGELAREIEQGGPVIQGRLAQGARAEIERIVGTNANDRVALQRIIKGEGDWNRQKLAQLFGQDRADRIINVLDRERAFAETSDVVTRNSETAARTAGQKDVTLPERQNGALRSAGNLQFGDAAARIGERITSAFRGAGQEAANTELATLLTSRDPQMLTRAIQMVQAAQRRGDISAERARQLISGMSVAGAQQGQRMELLPR